MTRIVGVHGIGAQYTASPALTQQWLLALRGGLDVAGARDKGDALSADALRVAHFGDLFRPRGAMGAGEPDASVEDLDRTVDRQFLEVLADSAVREEPSLESEGRMGDGRRNLNALLETLLRWRGFAGIAQRAFVGNLRQVNRFLDDEPIKRLALERLDRDIGDDTEIVIGHSLGSVVAYEYLCSRRPPSVRLFVTFGSPLGMPNIIFDRLTPRPVAGAGAWPGSVSTWVNVADQRDIVALVTAIADRFAPEGAGGGVEDRTVDNGDAPHSGERYLTSAEVGSAIADVL